jgi:hypothetical protein
MKQRFCLKHFLATLQNHVFSFFVHFLVKARTDFESSFLSREYPEHIQRAINQLPETGLTRARKEFRKSGSDLVYAQASRRPEIKIMNITRRQQVSSIWKVRAGLPMTINALESINSHRNEATPRRSPFWSSIFRLSQAVDRWIRSFNCSVRHNFNSATRRALVQMRAIGDAELLQQQIFSRTNEITAICDCGFTKYYSRLYHTQIPCCPLLSKWLLRLSMRQAPVLQYEPDTEFHLIVDKIERIGEEPSRERRQALVSMAAHGIKQLSKTGVNMEVIEQWVIDHFPHRRKCIHSSRIFRRPCECWFRPVCYLSVSLSE